MPRRAFLPLPLLFFLAGCGVPRTPAAFPDPPDDPGEAPSEVTPATPHVWTSSELVCHGGKKEGALRPRPNDEDAELGAALGRSPLFGISAPAQPSRRKVKNHVRRHPAQAADPDLAKAIDNAIYDTSRCADHEGSSADLTVEITADNGGVTKVRTKAPTNDALTRCLLEVACDVPVPFKAAALTASIPLRVRTMKDTLPKVIVLSQGGGVPPSTFTAPVEEEESSENDVAILGGLAREAAAACEQGQLLSKQAPFVDLGMAATPHSTVRPTVLVHFGQTSATPPPDTLLRCMNGRIDGFRLPLRPSHGVGHTRFRITWDG